MLDYAHLSALAAVIRTGSFERAVVSTLGQPRSWTRNPIAWILLLFFVAIAIGIIYFMLTQ
jgi:hypothetical protein